ncbi:inhibitor of growth proteins N-terminal histone-binding-domain-containing protein [Stachybotrys elegans]|uniref:Chromatin modification-related protein n=1 Tax=Stachybotrys elegans TaxID=80388 RepID=A0A8K0WW07_9HYPO|nr:inhibitor of growth proteins N-terminal histone-binding-domain-containing protein [Stachybotrys elegans]
MPRDDLSIDFVKRMPQGEPLDPGLILDDWTNRVQNLPEEIRFIHEEIADKDRQYNECIRNIEERDAKIQRWIKTNGSHDPNPKEEGLRAQIRDNFARADQLSQDKISLTQKLQIVMDKHLRSLDVQIKILYDRAEPGFADPDEVPSLLRPSAANHSAPSVRSINPAGNIISTGPSPSPLNAASTASPHPMPRLPNHAQVRHVQAQQQASQQQSQQTHQQLQQHAASAPTSPAASMMLNRQRESSAGPTPKRGPRVNSGIGNAPVTSSSLARHSSLGPGTPKGTSVAATAAGGVARAGSAGPRASSVKAAGGASARRGTPTAVARKKPPSKSSLSRVKKASSRNSPASTADSDLSDAESGSGDEDATDGRSRGTPAADAKDGDGDDVMGDADEDEEEGGDDKKYCLCHNVSYGDMVACDNDDCPYEWFHWSCVGLKSEPNGTWYCPECRKSK